MTKSIKPYGCWPPAIASSTLTQKSVRLGEPQLDQGHCYWLEQRPEEKGRCVVVGMASDDLNKDDISQAARDITPADMSVRTKAHEYGGGSYCVDQGMLYFVNAEDQRVYSMPVNHSADTQPALPTVLSPEAPSSKSSYRYADFFVDHTRNQLLAVCEIHREDQKEPENCIVSLRLDGSSTLGFNVLVFGNDFYSNPSVSPDGEKLTWLTWNHPNMPWDNSECWIADFNATGMLHKQRKVAGGAGGFNADKGESVFQPCWSPTGDLLFVSDRNNWWNLYSYNTYNKYTECLLDMPAEFATPQWVFGMSTYGFLNSYTLFCTYTQNGQWYVGTLDLMTQHFQALDVPFTTIEGVACQDDNDSAIFLGASENASPEVILWSHHQGDQQQWKSIARSSHLTLDAADIAAPKAISFNNSQQMTVHGFFYEPTNAAFAAPENEKPPLIVMSHGGPTGATNAALNMKVQFWTNRGFAVLDVNYSGSTGYGREYRRRLYPEWGLLDVDDVCSGADYLVDKGLVDGDRMAIRGSSAGGYSVLAALTFKDTFKAGASLYGIGDLCSLAEDTHKFEARYLDQLVGPYPDKKSIYQQRSPLNHINQLNCPVIFLQGLEDKVVPPNQAEMMVDALANKNIPVAHVTFEGEGHGFRQAENIRYSLDVEYAFYAAIFNFEVDGSLPPVPFVTKSQETH